MNIDRIREIAIDLHSQKRRRNAYKKYKKGVTIKKLTKEQKREIKEYYMYNFGVKVDTKHHELFYSITGVYKKEYMPFQVIDDLHESLSPFKYAKVIDNKALYPQLLPNIKLADRIVNCCRGVAFTYSTEGVRCELCEKEILELTSNLSECIIKPAVDSSAGIGVRCITVIDGIVQGTNETIKKLIDSYHGNYVIEKKVVNGQNLKCFNPTSCNTFRVHTWRNRETAKIEFVSSHLRIGAIGSITDNISAGGIGVPVHEDGTLYDSGIARTRTNERVKESETGVVFKGYKIENFDKVVDTAKRGHVNLPLFDFVGWDITVDENGDAIVIEFNANPDLRMAQVEYMDSCLLDKHIPILRQVYKDRCPVK